VICVQQRLSVPVRLPLWIVMPKLSASTEDTVLSAGKNDESCRVPMGGKGSSPANLVENWIALPALGPDGYDWPVTTRRMRKAGLRNWRAFVSGS
jgi:hypothetical protein